MSQEFWFKIFSISSTLSANFTWVDLCYRVPAECSGLGKPGELGNVREFENRSKSQGILKKGEGQGKVANFLKIFNCRPSIVHF